MNLRASPRAYVIDVLALLLLAGCSFEFARRGQHTELLLSLSMLLLAGRHCLNDYQSLHRVDGPRLALRGTVLTLVADSLLCAILLFCLGSFAVGLQQTAFFLAGAALLLAWRHALNDWESRPGGRQGMRKN
ncbi:hypothetical protein [Chitinilyticum litopenaei]|uniref:hypothetical protein n=1 Tax=Chitinilyticum litopenaei TaxID=1121276 RepID=UPI000405D605|nr:hypothetical protein [Chitinilyticum litopenaei]